MDKFHQRMFYLSCIMIDHFRLSSPQKSQLLKYGKPPPPAPLTYLISIRGTDKSEESKKLLNKLHRCQMFRLQLNLLVMLLLSIKTITRIDLDLRLYTISLKLYFSP